MRILLSGGGTGGHVYPAIAIANEMKKRYPNAEILFAGTSTGIESEIVPQNGYDIKTITVQGFKRKIDLDNVKRCAKLVKGLNDAKKIVKEFKPDVVIGTGGYVSGPVLLCASKNKDVVTVVHEQNAFPGVTNKILSKKVTRVITCFEDAKDKFPDKARKKITLIGNPVREELLLTNKIDARNNIKVPQDKKMVLIYGGSGGFKKINDAMLDTIKDMVEKDIAFVYATGKRFYDSFMEELNKQNLKLKEYQRVVPYLNDMANVLSASDMVIGSAGATSISEITALGKPSIIIPKAYTAENHQEFNAKSVENSGAGICILENELSYEKLSKELFNILMNEELLNKMSKNSLAIGKPNAVNEICDSIEELLNKKIK
ncbi:MAG: undecaprenyldiphospho-muramoylpentapeptide beta-N-acetylglucosaminyltransferase [Clostridium sp.]|nr:undecaprenyldiphospho-muramoylpentapeptide beta-N-acetylglucosaminyltransferase [Clostridium sp.]MBQ9000134.1 undecaprenyldiphospho-muramoylpentapeptide beta-N-acetylglucosaminyltransferase [Clostridium sp.]